MLSFSRAMFTMSWDKLISVNIFTAVDVDKTEGICDLHIVVPQLKLYFTTIFLAHSPKIDYFATNYLQM